MKTLVFFLLGINFCYGQWTPSNPLMPAPADCPIAYRICDAAKTYNFELVDDGAIDDAHGSLGIPGLNKSSPTQFESKSAWLVFTPQYSGEFGFSICPETVEDLAFLLFLNPNCADIETGNYSIVTQSGNISDTNNGCTGLGYNPNTGLGGGDWDPYYNIIAGNTYGLFVSLENISQPGTHRFTLSFQGQVIIDHPDLFDFAGCNMATPNFALQDKVKIYPNPFEDYVNIESDLSFKTIELYDVMGKLVIKQDFVKQLDTSKIAKGFYLLKLITVDGSIINKKIMR